VVAKYKIQKPEFLKIGERKNKKNYVVKIITCKLKIPALNAANRFLCSILKREGGRRGYCIDNYVLCFIIHGIR
jgi:hypothetical protein